MAVPANFWTTEGDPVRWVDNFDGYYASRSTGSVPKTNVSFTFSDCRFYNAPLIRGTGDKATTGQMSDGVDTGYFYGVHKTLGTIKTMVLFHIGGYLGDATWVPWCEPLLPLVLPGNLEPSGGSWLTEEAKFVTGFIMATGGSTQLWGRCNFYFWGSVTNDYEVFHYAPYAWKGRPPEVIAAIAMKAGLDPGSINQTSFEETNEAYDDTTGTIPWSSFGSPDNEFHVWAVRVAGEKVVDMILEVARHTRDFYYVDEKGSLAVSSYTDPPVHAGLTVADGVIAVQWKTSQQWLFNHVSSSYGSATKQWGDAAPSPIGDNSTGSIQPGATEETMLASYMGKEFVHELADAASVTKYGEHWLPGRTFIVDELGTPRTVTRAHYPLQHSPSGVSGSLVPAASYWLTSDSKPRVFITVVQDFRGLDYGIGDKLTGVKVTGDGVTYDDVRCIEKTIDFDALTVTSLLVQIPTNT